jgi:hypothetical protein
MPMLIQRNLDGSTRLLTVDNKWITVPPPGKGKLPKKANPQALLRIFDSLIDCLEKVKGRKYGQFKDKM